MVRRTFANNPKLFDDHAIQLSNTCELSLGHVLDCIRVMTLTHFLLLFFIIIIIVNTFLQTLHYTVLLLLYLMVIMLLFVWYKNVALLALIVLF